MSVEKKRRRDERRGEETRGGKEMELRVIHVAGEGEGIFFF